MQRIVHLTPPSISSDHIKEKITCIRAHRERIFHVSEQITNDKFLYHNYGQGGAGWTFLFGCVNESMRLFEQRLILNSALKNKPICVIGAGCYGLLTAVTLAHKGYNVHIVAKDTQNIPSYNAAGFFFPRARKSSTQQERTIFESLGMESYNTYKQIIHETHPFIKTGAHLLPAYYGHDIDPGFTPYIVQGLMAKPEKVTISFNNDKKYEAIEYKTVFINALAMMQELQKCITNLGIKIIKAEINSFDDLDELIIFNCSGQGAKKLTDDKRIIPVQGHLITLKNQPISDLQYMINAQVIQTTLKGTPRNELIYFAPKEAGILGITFIRGEDSLTANAHEFDRLLERCQDFFGT